MGGKARRLTAGVPVPFFKKKTKQKTEDDERGETGDTISIKIKPFHRLKEVIYSHVKASSAVCRSAVVSFRCAPAPLNNAAVLCLNESCPATVYMHFIPDDESMKRSGEIQINTARLRSTIMNNLILISTSDKVSKSQRTVSQMHWFDFTYPSGKQPIKKMCRRRRPKNIVEADWTNPLSVTLIMGQSDFCTTSGDSW